MGDSPRVVAVVVNYNSSDYVAHLLESLHGEGVARVLIWDNASRAEDVGALRTIVRDQGFADLQESPINWGFGGGVNRAIGLIERDGGADFYWVLNPDIIVRPGTLAPLLQASDNEKAGIVSPLIVRRTPDGAVPRIWFAGGRLDAKAGRSIHLGIGQPEHSVDRPFVDSSFVTGAAPLIRADVWRFLGGFDESLFLYCEDAEWSMRATRLGVRMGVVSDAVVEHWEGGSSGGHGPGETFYYYVQRNRITVYRDSASLSGLLVGRGLAETARLFWFTHRAERPVRAFSASWQGLIAGVRGERGPRAESVPLAVLAVYHEARTAHLERLQERPQDALRYFRRSYDFDETLVNPAQVRASGALQSAIEIVRRRPAVVELNEPLMLKAWPALLFLLLAVRVARVFGGRTIAVTYAIENADPTASFRAKLRLPRWAGRLLLRGVGALIVGSFDRIAFGTPGAQEGYVEAVGAKTMDRVSHAYFPALGAPDPEAADTSKRSGSVHFLGAFEERKGIEQLLDAWPIVRGTEPSAEMTILGKGPLQDRVAAWCEANGAHLIIDPSREEIHTHLLASSVGVLFSQPRRAWREQVGLPIVEALSAGCTIVTSDQTGIAPWLAEHGHQVVPAGAGADALALAILRALAQPMEPAEVLASLPTRGGRAEAQDWMTS